MIRPFAHASSRRPPPNGPTPITAGSPSDSDVVENPAYPEPSGNIANAWLKEDVDAIVPSTTFDAAIGAAQTYPAYADAGGTAGTNPGPAASSTDLNPGTPGAVTASPGAPAAAPLLLLGFTSMAIMAALGAGSRATDSAAPQIRSVDARSPSTTVDLVFDEAIDPANLPPVSAFLVTTNGIANPVTTVSASGKVLTLRLAQTFTAGSLTVSYTDPSSSNDTGAIQDLAGNDLSSFLRGIVADGYIGDAEIFLDTDGSGTADANESTGVFTAADGSFLLPDIKPGVAIMALGGINIDTGLPQTVPLKAPADSQVINPLTTLVWSVIERASDSGRPISAAVASSRVADALGLSLPSGLSLTSFDPIARDDAQGVAAQQAAVQIATLVNLAAGSDRLVADKVMAGLASRLDTTPDASIEPGRFSATELGELLSSQGLDLAGEVQTRILTTMRLIENASTLGAIRSVQRGAAADAQAPAAPSSISAIDDMGGGGSLSSGDSTGDFRPTLRGIAEPGSTVRVYDGNLLVGSGIADSPGGTWSVTTRTLAIGNRVLSAKATDAAGNTSPVSAQFLLTVIDDSVPPAAPLVALASDDVGAIRGDIAASGTTDDLRPALSGTAEPGAIVRLYDGSDLVGVAQADDPGGAWSITTVPLANGNRVLTATATDAFANTSAASSAFVLTISVDRDAPSPPEISAVADDVGGTRGAVAPAGTLDDNQPTFTGISEPGTTVGLYDGSTLVGTAVADAVTGVWTITTRALTEGLRSMSARATDAAGNTGSASSPFPLTVATDTIAPMPPSVAADPSDLLALAGGGYKAMVADAAMLAGLMKQYNTDADPANDLDVAGLLNDDLAISANSGSTWFVNLLAFSPSFVRSLNDYTSLFATDQVRDVWTDYSPGINTAGSGADGFFGVMGEQYNAWLNQYVDQLASVLRPALARDLSSLRSVADLASYLDDSSGNLGRFLIAGIADGGSWLLVQLDKVLSLAPGYTALRDRLVNTLGSPEFKQFIGAASIALIEGIDWNVFAQKAVFAPDQTDLLLRDINFYTSDSSDPGSASNRTVALATQSLIYQLALSSDEAAIAPEQITFGSDVVKASVTNSEARYGFLNRVYNFIPASATSLGDAADQPAPWLPSILSGELGIEYDAGFLEWGVDTTYTDLDFAGLSAFLSSSISSAAAALGGSYGVLGNLTTVAGLLVNGLDLYSDGKLSNVVLDYTKGLAPLVKATRNPDGSFTAGDPAFTSAIDFIDPIETTSSANAARQGYLRMADGGYFDNTSVTSGLSYLFANRDASWVPNDGKEDFDITLFTFSALGEAISTTLADRGFDDLGSNVERIFKDGAQQRIAALGIDILDVSHPNSALFESANGLVSGMDAPIWSYTDSGATGSGAGFAIKAYSIRVTTIADNTMNIGAGYEGRLDVWNIISSTGSIPLETMGTWNDYEVLYNQIIAGLQTTNNGYVGAALLAQSLI